MAYDWSSGSLYDGTAVVSVYRPEDASLRDDNPALRVFIPAGRSPNNVVLETEMRVEFLAELLSENLLDEESAAKILAHMQKKVRGEE